MSTTPEELLTQVTDDGTVPGGVTAVCTAGGEPDIVAGGLSSVDGAPMAKDAIFRIQSMTKPVTAAAALRLVEAARLSLDDNIEYWLPELAGRRVLTSPDAQLTDTVPAVRPITLRHLLTNMSGYGNVVESPLMRAMQDNGTYAGPEPVALDADAWLSRMAELPLAFQPGEGWRYHHSFGILGILLSRVVGMPLNEHLRTNLFEPLGMIDTGYWAPPGQSHRLPAAYRHGDSGLVETDPAGRGFYATEPPFDVSHSELVSTAGDYARFLRMLADGGVAADGGRLLSAEHVAMMTADQTPASAKTPESFFPGFWNDQGWGFGVGVHTGGPYVGRFEWSGGQGTTFWVDPDGTVAILLTQVEIGPRMFTVLEAFQHVAPR